MTNGGFIIRSMPLMVAATGVGLEEAVGPALGDGDVAADGDGEASGDGDGEAAAAVSVNRAQGLGGTLAHSLWRPGASPAKGMTLVVKLPFASALDAPATLVGKSQ
jgi:hypothetical protein